MTGTFEEICTLASRKLGKDKVEELENPTSKHEKVFSEIYEQVLENALLQADWSFAIKDVSLSRLTTEPIDSRFDYHFDLPSDYLYAVSGHTTSGYLLNLHADYLIQGRKLLSDRDAIVLKYIHRPAATDLPPAFISFYVDFLAYRASEALVPNRNALSQSLRLDKEDSLATAIRLNAQENLSKPAQKRNVFRTVRGS